MKASQVVRTWINEWCAETGPAEEALIQHLELLEKRKNNKRKRFAPHTKPCNLCMGTGRVSVALQAVSGHIRM